MFDRCHDRHHGQVSIASIAAIYAGMNGCSEPPGAYCV
jgi:hypothetical protein